MISLSDISHLKTLFGLRKWSELRFSLQTYAPEDVAELLLEFPKSERVIIFRALHRKQAADSFSFLEDEDQIELLKELTDQETRDVLAHMSPDDRTFFLEEMPAPVTKKLLSFLSLEDRKEAMALLGYPEGSVGRLMTPDFARVQAHLSVGQAMAEIRAQAADSETLNMIYIIDEEGRLLDAVRLRHFIAAPIDRPVVELMDGRYSSLSAFAPREEAVHVMRQKGYFSLPVTDSNNILLGVVTADDVLDVAMEEATEDMHKGGAVRPLEIGYLRAPLSMLYRRRISWLVILVFMNIFSGAGIAHYEALIESVVALVFFLPLLIDSGGNAGSQAATLVIRGMALGEVRIRDYVKVAWREIYVALGLGLSIALAVFFVAWWRSGYEVATVVAISMVVIVFLGSLVGMSLPFILRKIGMDPAAASAPLVTSVADIMGVMIYLSFASFLLGIL